MPGPALVAVVVPVFRQPHFLAGAVLSALRHDGSVDARVVVVDDGCPYPETRAEATRLAAAHPEHVRVLHQPNRGLSAARNAGIALALEAWPGLDAVFPLDCDNLLSPGTLGALWRALAADPEAVWASPPLELFGGEDGVWQVPEPVSRYRQRFENQVDAGALLHRRLLDAGLRYDEDMRGYEDWELVLRASLQGLRGVAAPRCGFRYRRRAHSLLQESRGRRESLLAHMRARHLRAFHPAAVARDEHAEVPRAALVACDAGRAELLAATDLEPACEDLASFAGRVAATAGGWLAGDAPVPPVVLLGTGAAFAALRDTRVLPGVLLRVQLALTRARVVGLRLVADGPLVREGSAGDATVLALRATDLAAHGRAPLEAALVLEVAVGTRVAAVDPAPALDAVAATGPVAVAAPQPTHAVFSAFKHLAERATAVPWAGPAGAAPWWVLVPSLDAAGADGVVALVAALRERAGAGAVAAHLVLTGADGALPPEGLPAVFDTVTALGGDGEQVELLAHLLADAALVLDAGGDAGVRAAALRRPAGVHVRDLRAGALDDAGVPRDEALLAAQEGAAVVDAHLVASERDRRLLVALEVVPARIALVGEGPAVAPLTRVERAPGDPLRLLHLGALDARAAVRLAHVVRALRAAGHGVTLTAADGPAGDRLPAGARLVPAPAGARLAALLAEADVVLGVEAAGAVGRAAAAAGCAVAEAPAGVPERRACAALVAAVLRAAEVAEVAEAPAGAVPSWDDAAGAIASLLRVGAAA